MNPSHLTRSSTEEQAPVETRWISCNACGADNFRNLSSVDQWSIGRCGECGLVYVNPIPFFAPSPVFSDLSYEFEYTRYMRRPVTETILAFEREQLASNLEEIARLRGERVRPPGRLRFLDIGCGSGASVCAATQLGWDAIGIDIDPELVRQGKEQLDVDLRCAPLLNSALPDGTFDFIKLRDVIEHLPNPYESLVKIRSLLSPEGVALIATPNDAGLVMLAKRGLGRKRTQVATVVPPHHLHGFHPRSLRRILERAQFHIFEIRTTTPVDARYVTSNNMRSSGRRGMGIVWQLGRALGMGAMLVAWVRR